MKAVKIKDGISVQYMEGESVVIITCSDESEFSDSKIIIDKADEYGENQTIEISTEQLFNALDLIMLEKMRS